MPKQSSELPPIAWPEHYGPTDGKEVVDAIIQVFQIHGKCDIFSSGVKLIFVPDPPVINEAADLFMRSVSNLTSAQLHPFHWGTRGLAYLCCDMTSYRQLIAAFLAMKSTTLSIIAFVEEPGYRTTTGQLTGLIRAFLDNAPEAADRGVHYAGLFFECGALR